MTTSVPVNPLRIALAQSEQDIARCFPVMSQLRPHVPADQFVDRVRQQQAGGYHIAFLEAAKRVRSVAGFRVLEMLHSGRTLYVDDLVTEEASRSQRFGDQLFDWLVSHARERSCRTFSLDSGTHRVDAHRFYLRKRMRISSFHFDLPL